MRTRNPCVFARRRLRGWYVRFGKAIPLVVWQNFRPQAVSSALFEFPSVVDPRVHGQENAMRRACGSINTMATSDAGARSGDLNRAIQLEYLTIGWNLLEGTIAIA